MNIHLERSLEIGDSMETVSRRLNSWSKKYGLICTRDTLGDWAFRRGTHFQTSYTFDVRKVPTTVTVTMTDGQPAEVYCSILVKSWLNIATPGDPKRVEEQIHRGRCLLSTLILILVWISYCKSYKKQVASYP